MFRQVRDIRPVKVAVPLVDIYAKVPFWVPEPLDNIFYLIQRLIPNRETEASQDIILDDGTVVHLEELPAMYIASSMRGDKVEARSNYGE